MKLYLQIVVLQTAVLLSSVISEKPGQKPRSRGLSAFPEHILAKLGSGGDSSGNEETALRYKNKEDFGFYEKRGPPAAPPPPPPSPAAGSDEVAIRYKNNEDFGLYERTGPALPPARSFSSFENVKAAAAGMRARSGIGGGAGGGAYPASDPNAGATIVGEPSRAVLVERDNTARDTGTRHRLEYEEEKTKHAIIGENTKKSLKINAMSGWNDYEDYPYYHRPPYRYPRYHRRPSHPLYYSG